MKNVLFVLVNTIDPLYFRDHHISLKKIHHDFVAKINAPTLIVGDENNTLSNHCFKNFKELYQFVIQQRGLEDIIWCDAFAGVMNMKDCEEILNYCREGLYDVCLTENLPDGLLPNIVSANFALELEQHLKDDMPITATLNNLINWEFQGIDVGMFLSPSALVMKRLEFLPHTQNGMHLIECSKQYNLRLLDWENFLQKNPSIQRFTPQYIAIELCAKTDNLGTRKFNTPEMSLELARKIVTEIELYAPDALISLGVWGEPFMHSHFKEIFSLFASLPNKILVESRTLILNEQLWMEVLKRENTELIFDISAVVDQDFHEYKHTDFSLSEAIKRITLLPKDHVWPRLTRCPGTESSIKEFFRAWSSYKERVLIQKMDSFGSLESQVVDLSPLQRHSCYALRRELTVLSDGSVLVCRQSTHIIGSLQKNSIKQIWQENKEKFLQQEQGDFSHCTECKQCDDWWIWN